MRFIQGGVKSSEADQDALIERDQTRFSFQQSSRW